MNIQFGLIFDLNSLRLKLDMLIFAFDSDSIGASSHIKAEVAFIIHCLSSFLLSIFQNHLDIFFILDLNLTAHIDTA